MKAAKEAYDKINEKEWSFMDYHEFRILTKGLDGFEDKVKTRENGETVIICAKGNEHEDKVFKDKKFKSLTPEHQTFIKNMMTHVDFRSKPAELVEDG